MCLDAGRILLVGPCICRSSQLAEPRDQVLLPVLVEVGLQAHAIRAGRHGMETQWKQRAESVFHF